MVAVIAHTTGIVLCVHMLTVRDDLSSPSSFGFLGDERLDWLFAIYVGNLDFLVFLRYILSGIPYFDETIIIGFLNLI